MKVIAICNTRIEAEILVSKLRASGIEGMIAADDLGGQNPFMATITKVKVLVADQDEERAEDLFSQPEDEHDSVDDCFS